MELAVHWPKALFFKVIIHLHTELLMVDIWKFVRWKKISNMRWERREKKIKRDRRGEEWRRENCFTSWTFGRCKGGGWDVAFPIMIACHHGTLMTIKILLQSILCDSLSYGYSLGSTIWELPVIINSSLDSCSQYHTPWTSWF